MNVGARQSVQGARLGFFEDFKSSETILIEADDDGLRRMIAACRALESGAEQVAIHELPFVHNDRDLRLFAARGTRDRITRLSPNEFRWESSAPGWLEAAEKLDRLTESACGHQFFETASDRIVIQVSKNEYGAKWWDEHRH
jgi:hypothetical protein